MHGCRSWVLVALLASAWGCDSKGTCEYKFDDGSADGSIPAGLQVCQPEWKQELCSSAANNATLGLGTSGYVFTQGAKCEERGYKDCSGGRNLAYYRDCNLQGTASASAPAPEPPPPPSTAAAPDPSAAPRR